ncbi:MAG: AMP-binding protein, partial [Janthinobacterium lividum]
MSDQLYPVSPAAAGSTHLNAEAFATWTERARTDHDGFWAEQARRVSWIKPPTKILSGDFTGDVQVKWYEDGTLNASATCLDRHLEGRPDQVAIIWEGDDPNSSRSVTYRELHGQVCRFANVLKSLGAKKGDRITIYLPMVIEAAVSMLACARIGAIHSIVFGGFSPDSLANRIGDCDS